ncbi:MAG: hypothetical protein R6V06_09355 [Kiritimatiellia bacterium]
MIKIFHESNLDFTKTMQLCRTSKVGSKPAAACAGWGQPIYRWTTIFKVGILLTVLLVTGTSLAQKWVNPKFDGHRLDYRDLGYPDVNAVPADNSPVTALLTSEDGMVYGATSGKSASYLFLYDRAINKVRPLGHIEENKGVYHALLQDADGSLLIGGGLNMLAPVKLTRDFPGGFRAIEKQLWKDIAAPYADYTGGHLYRYDPVSGNKGARLPGEACPLEDLGIPVKNNTIYAMAIDKAARQLYGITYPDALFFVWDLRKNKLTESLPLLKRKIYSGPERQWRSIPRALFVDKGVVNSSGAESKKTGRITRIYTSGEDGRIVYYDTEKKKIVATGMQIPGEYYEAWNYYGYPVLEAWQATPDGSLYGATTDGYLFRLDKSRQQLTNLGKPRLSRRVRGMSLGHDNRLYMICGQFEEPCKLFSYGLDGKEGFHDWGGITVDRSPYYAKRAYQFDAITTGIDGTLFMGESDRRACLYMFIPGAEPFTGGFNPKNPRDNQHEH